MMNSSREVATGFLSKLFGCQDDPQDSAAGMGVKLDRIMDAAATALAYRHNGWLDVIRDGEDVVGFWLGELPSAEMIQPLLKRVAASERVDDAAYLSIALDDYRLVQNSFDDKGGHYVMIGSAQAPNERIPPLEDFRWQEGEPNPESATVSRYTVGVPGVRFTCPTCGIPNFCSDDLLGEIVGTMVSCGSCRNISHVPAALKAQSNDALFPVYGCSFVPISEFSDWFINHPSFNLDNAEDLGSYGLWGFCANCRHRFASTVLATFPTASIGRGLIFNAHSQASAEDMQGLMDGACPECRDANLLALLTEIPPVVKAAIQRQRTENPL